ncbi:MAG: TetR/AcrR family transcriptional regulator [Chloroflexi bacterium]|nr:TetR/AcrR family transcriptional regulator [Chloroflexota bacterium]
MPHPGRIDRGAITEAARCLLEERGLDAVTMRELARQLGVRAPSLYFHVANREEVLRLLVQRGLEQLGTELRQAAAGVDDPGERLHALFDSYTQFAFANPGVFGLLFGPCPDERRLPDVYGEQSAAPLLETVGELVPATDVLDVAQGLWALVHGYTALSLSAQFRLGGEPYRAMHRTLDLLLKSLNNCDTSVTLG